MFYLFFFKEYIDEFGNKQYRVKKMVVGKDKDGNEIITVFFFFKFIKKLFIFNRKVILIQKLESQLLFKKKYIKIKTEMYLNYKKKKKKINIKKK